LHLQSGFWARIGYESQWSRDRPPFASSPRVPSTMRCSPYNCDNRCPPSTVITAPVMKRDAQQKRSVEILKISWLMLLHLVEQVL
jgi:hypothetical protein